MLRTKMNFFKQLFYAVIKPTQYYRLTKVSGGRNTSFTFLFLFIMSLFSILPMLYDTIGPKGMMNALHENLPDFELSDGILEFSERYEFHDSSVYVLIDTNIERFDYKDINRDYGQVILISRTNLLNYKSYGRLQEIKFEDLGGFHLNNIVIEKLALVLYPIIAFIAIFIYLFYVATYYFMALMYSLVGLFVSSISNAHLTYATIFKTAIYSKVTIRILYSLIDLTSLSLPGYLRISIAFVVTCAYVVFGILSHTSKEAYEEAGFPMPPFHS